MVGWTPTAPDTIEDRLGSLGERAKKRAGLQLTPNKFLVMGNPKLSDAYDKYEVELVGQKYECSCQTHAGGQYRKMCSHIAYIVMARRGLVPWLEERPTLELVEPDFSDLPSAPYPPFVSDGPIPAEARAQMIEMFGYAEPLPDWVGWIYPHQWDAYAEILFQFDSGKKVVFLSAPTGSGKTLIGEMVRRSIGAQAMYLCTTKTLQDQVEHDFPYVAVIKGRANYPTLNHPTSTWLACDLCQMRTPLDSCQYCRDTDLCPYRVARDKAVKSQITVANTAYFLFESNGLKTRFGGGRRKVIIVDEADSLEEELMRYIEIGFSPRTLKSLGIGPPEKKTVSGSWQDWLEKEARPALIKKLYQLQSRSDPRDVREHRHLTRLWEQTEALTFDDNWVYTDYESGWVRFKPVKVDPMASEVLWRHSDRWLLMSATIISAQQMAEDLGLDDDEWTVVDVESTFPPENRPVYIEPVANITAKTKETEWPRALKRIEQIAAWHDERILVHTVSYHYAKYLTEGLGPRAMTYTSAKERQEVLARWLESSNGIMVAPSFERGIDLPYDQCRVVIVAKVPFPNLGDKQVNKRLYSKGGQGWYCVSPDTRVLREDLTWVEAGKLTEGEILFGFDEDGPWRRWKPSTIEAIGPTVQETYSVDLEDGLSLVSSATHRWLVQINGVYQWRMTKDLRRTNRLVRLAKVWETDHSREAGYLAGFLDGEGNISFSSSNSQSRALRVSYAQNDGVTAAKVLEEARKMGFQFREYRRKDGHDLTAQYVLLGGRSETMRLLGQIRPVRLLDKFSIDQIEGNINAIDLPRVLSVTSLGEQELIGIQTSAGTYIAEGLASHNSMQTVRALVQMTGRAMRRADDTCESYIIDRQFLENVWKKSRHLIPEWWREAVMMSGSPNYDEIRRGKR